MASVILLSVMAGLSFAGRFMDDAYISFRFAYFIGEGLPFRWNPQDAPIEGFTNVLWTLLMVPFAHHPTVIETFVHWLAVACVAATGVVLVVIGARRAQVRGSVVGVALFVAAISVTGFWDGALNGIETPMYLFALTVATVVVFRDKRTGGELYAAIALVLLSLVRFDGVIFAILLGVIYLVRSRLAKGSLRSSATPLVAVALVFLAASVFRILYFGNPIPLSVNAKTTNWVTLLVTDGADAFLRYFSRVVTSGGEYLASFAESPAVWLLLAAFAVAIAISPESVWVKLLVAMVPAAGFGIAVLNWGDWMPGFRLLTPFLGVAAAFSVRPLSDAFAEVSGRAAKVTIAVTWAFVALSMMAGIAVPGGLAGVASAKFNRSYEAEAKAWGVYWDDIVAVDEVYVAARGGVLPYSAPELRNFGYHGLFDECIGRSGYTTSGSTGKRNWDCVFRHPPAVLDANNIPFALSVAEQALARDYAISVALCGTNIRLTGGRYVFFVANWKIPSALEADPGLVFVPLRRWLDDPEAFAQGDACDQNPGAEA